MGGAAGCELAGRDVVTVTVRTAGRTTVTVCAGVLVMVWAAATEAEGLATELAVLLNPRDPLLLVEPPWVAEAAGTVAEGEEAEFEDRAAGLSAADNCEPGFGDPDSEITTASRTIAATAHPARNSQLRSRKRWPKSPVSARSRRTRPVSDSVVGIRTAMLERSRSPSGARL